MIGRNLKNYEIYLDKIKAYAKASALKIVRKTEPSDGSYSPHTSTIVIDPDLDESTEIATLLHELGHAFDYKLDSSPSTWDAYYKVYTPEGPTPLQLEKVIEAEIRAWENGVMIAKRLKIPLGKWYAAERKVALTNYRKV